ncbi:MAG TPA: hypothetical protein VHC97_22115 [Thermoanaerobaculia bacterium]|jgi:hypothetical protein|nr:hypothetical protein [Thermoanaerobaculia bacterium]
MKPFLLGIGIVFLLGPLPARAHQGPPFPIVEDQRAGPYAVSVWADPDVGTGTFFVILDPPARARVRIGLQPVSGRLPEKIYEAQPSGDRYFASAPLDKAEMWRVRALLDGPEGGGELKAEVEATPDGTLGPWASLIYLLPFAGVGFLWLKAAMRRRSPAPSLPSL